jgi:hypothetical protein
MQEVAVRFPSSPFNFYIKMCFWLSAQAPDNLFRCRLDINVITVDATTKTVEASVYADSCLTPALPSEVSPLITLDLFSVPIYNL